MNIREEDVNNLRHMVGADAKQRDRGYRNYYGTNRDDPEMARLVEQGLAVFSHASHPDIGGMVYFKATRLGCLVAGLNEAQTKRALEG